MTQEEVKEAIRLAVEKDRLNMSYKHILLKLVMKSYKHELKRGGQIHTPAQLIEKADVYNDYILGVNQEESQE